ncbi:unnamed protein product [Closterium sp. NIES-53]
MVADSSDNNPKSNGGAEKKKERTTGQFFHIGEQGEQGDASAKVGAELHPLDYWVLDTGAAWTMTRGVLCLWTRAEGGWCGTSCIQGSGWQAGGVARRSPRS